MHIFALNTNKQKCLVIQQCTFERMVNGNMIRCIIENCAICLICFTPINNRQNRSRMCGRVVLILKRIKMYKFVELPSVVCIIFVCIATGVDVDDMIWRKISENYSPKFRPSRNGSLITNVSIGANFGRIVSVVSCVGVVNHSVNFIVEYENRFHSTVKYRVRQK
jgi:hypothetical protein